MSVSPPFQISAQDVARSSLDRDDIGLWALLVTGCFHLFDSEAAAQRAYRLLLEGVAIR